MRLLVSSTGTHGDVQPCVALARGLAAAGHDVEFASHPSFESLVTGAGLKFAALWEPDPRRVMRDVQHGTVGKSASLRIFKHLYRRRPPPREALERQVELCRGRDFVLSPIGNYLHAAEAVGVPFGFLAPYPTLPTRGFPHHLSRLRRSVGGPLNWLTHFAFQQFFWQPDRQWVNGWRRELGLAPMGWRGPHPAALARRVPYFFGYSPSVIPRPRDWPDSVHVTGYWFLDTASAFEAPVELVRFLAGGEPPVVIAFGSLVDIDPAGLQRLLLEAIAASGERAILLSGWAKADGQALPPNVFRADWVPLPWLLPRARLLVHHGGAGTMAEALRAGVPSVTVPASGEQKFWAARLHALGAAPRPMPRLKLIAAGLAGAIREAVTRDAILAKAAELAGRIRAENGVVAAVAAFEREAARQRLR
jgi:sterol 3beta-glucosyltransferase